MDGSSLTLEDYQESVSATNRSPESFVMPLLGLFGETGSLLSEVKKQQRDTISYHGYADNVLEEIGDVLWYMTAVASRAGLSISNIASNIMNNGSEYRNEISSRPSFAEIQNHPTQDVSGLTREFEETLMYLAGAVGTIVKDYHDGKIESDKSIISRHLTTIFKYLIQAAEETGLSLGRAAQMNLNKVFDRWPRDRHYPDLFDDEFPVYEQLPRRLTIEIIERPAPSGDKSFVMQNCNGINIGDRLTDNAIEQDDYRFHDIFHYAYAAVLGWSPVTRALLHLKRKSNDRIDEVEDGARAILIEEGVTTWIFGQAMRLQFFEDIEPGNLSFDLLKNIRRFVAGYEVEKRPLWLWEDAVLQGYECFRFLKEHRCGRVNIDMHNRRISIENIST